MHQRFVALGDSFSEGLGDPQADRPRGVRGWADRVAEVLGAAAERAGEPFGYANLAVRGRKLDQVLDEQVGPALALRPDLVTVYAGANDVLRPRVDLDGLVERYGAALGRVSATGAQLVVFTAFDPGGSAIYSAMRGRFAVYNELVRDVAARQGAAIVDFWRLRDYRDWGYWDTDRMHMGPAGHLRMAHEVLDVLGMAHELPAPAPRAIATPTRSEALREHVVWTRESAVPWVHRRLTGRSSGDGLGPRYPNLIRLASPTG